MGVLTLETPTNNKNKVGQYLQERDAPSDKLISLSASNRVKQLALSGIPAEDMIKIVVLPLADIKAILDESLGNEQIKALNIPRLTQEFEQFVKFKDEQKACNGDGAKLNALYENYKNDRGDYLLPKAITYGDISEYRNVVNKVTLDNKDQMLTSLRKKLIHNLLAEANNDMIPRRDAVGILRVIGTGEINDNNKNNLSNLTEVGKKGNTYNIVFNPENVKGQGNLTISDKGQVVGVDGEVTNNISRSDLVEMLSNLD